MKNDEAKQSGPIKLPLKPMDALRALLQVKPPPKDAKGSPKKQKPRKSRG